MKNTGIILIILGAIMMAITGFNFVTREKVVDIGSIQIDSKENHPVQWSPVVGGVLLAAGLGLLVLGKKK